MGSLHLHRSGRRAGDVQVESSKLWSHQSGVSLQKCAMVAWFSRARARVRPRTRRRLGLATLPLSRRRPAAGRHPPMRQ